MSVVLNLRWLLGILVPLSWRESRRSILGSDRLLNYNRRILDLVSSVSTGVRGGICERGGKWDVQSRVEPQSKSLLG